MTGSTLMRRTYAAYLRASLRGRPTPRHVGLIMDGNRRWARQAGYGDPSVGHRFGANHLQTVLGWTYAAGIDRVTAYVASADNLRKRARTEVDALIGLVETVVSRALTDARSPWSVRLSGDLDLLPPSAAIALKECVEATRGRPATITLGIGYDPRLDMVEAIRGFLDAQAASGRTVLEAAEAVTPEAIAAQFAASEDIDFVIRTSGEQRVSGFFPWQSVGADLYVCDVYWPGFREIDLLRALRAYAQRRRR